MTSFRPRRRSRRACRIARVAHLSEPASGGGLNGGVFLNGDTVHDDGVSDQIDALTGSAGDDWYLYTRSSGDRATGITAIEAGEVINNI